MFTALKKFGLHILILFLTLIGVWVENIPLNQTKHQQGIVNQFTNYIKNYEEAQIQLLTADGPKKSLYPLQLFIFSGDSAVYWSSDKVAFKPFKVDDSIYSSYRNFNDGFYRVFAQKDKEGLTHYSLLKLAHHFPNAVHGMPQNKAVRFVEVGDELILKSTPTDSSFFPINIQGSSPDFYVKILTPEIGNDWCLWFYIPALLLLLALVARLFIFSKTISTKDYRISALFVFGFLLLLRITFAKGIFLQFLSQSPLFSPELFAHSYLSSSYGESFLNILIIVFLLLFFRKTKLLKGRIGLLPAMLIINALIGFFIYWQLNEMQHLIIDSKINLDPTVIDELNVYTLLGIVLIGLYLSLFFIFCICIRELINTTYKNTRYVYLISLIMQLVFVAIAAIFAINTVQTWFIWIGWILLALSAIYFIVNYSQTQDDWSKIFVMLAFVLLNSHLINGLLEKKEHEYRKIYAYKMLHERDLELERRLLEAEDKLEGNNVFESCIYEDSAFNREEFEEILKYDYLIDFMSDFDIFIESFSGNSANWTARQRQSFDSYHKLYLETSEDGLSHSFLKVQESSGFSGYISAHITGDFNSSDFQSVFILLRQKVRSSQRALSEFAGKSAGIPTSPYNYFHALYINDKLNRVSPEFPFERYNVRFRTKAQESFIEQQGFSFFIYQPEPERVLVLATPLRSTANRFTVFAGLMLSFFTIWFLFLSLRLSIRLIVLNVKRLLSGHRNKFYFPAFKNMLLQSKIQTALMVELILSFVAGTVMVANFITVNYEDTQQRQILEKIRGISGELEKSGIMDFGIKTGPKREFLIDLSESYNIDISLFNLNGTLWLSSSPDLYKNAVINEFMNPSAYLRLAHDKLYSFNQNERLYGYKYGSYYQAFFDHNQSLAGYIHLPFFARQQETNRELTSLLVNMLNIFVIFFIITGVISIFLSKVITRPLAGIALSLRKLRVGGKNEEISWQSNDEIGQLVKTYNKVLNQLEESVEKLASTEREGAWREMAKQVAHEIKNPLTPMRLSVQHLLRSVSQTAPDVQEKIKKVSELLINQIDLMSKMAEEFSSFAKMPMAIPEKFDVCLMLLDTVELFEKSEDFEISTEGTHAKAIVHADKDQIKRVFTNLIKNAYQAKQEDSISRLKIALSIVGKEVLISFADNGVGIEEELKEKIFHPNFSTKTSGMGLGLAISKKIIELAGGNISFESTPGEGTTFYITLPLAEN